MSSALHLLNIAKFALGGTTPLTGPAKVQWELTYRCNLKCEHCHIWQIKDFKDELTTDEVLRILGELKAAGTRHVSFSGGEMFMRKDVFDIIRHAKSLGLKVGANSNGWVIDEAMAGRVASSGLDMVYISVDGSSPEVHDRIRGINGSHDRAIRAIRALKAHPSPKVFVNTTINDDNAKDIVALVELLDGLGIDGITMEPIHCFEKYGPASHLVLTESHLPVLQEQLEEAQRRFPDRFPHLKEYFSEFGTFVTSPADLYRYRCVAAYASIQIHPNGDVYPCPAAFKKMGSLKERSFGEIWTGEAAAALRREIKAGKHPICWVTCVGPLNVYLSYVHPARFHKLAQPRLIRHMLRKA